jgi:hypothetical protein
MYIIKLITFCLLLILSISILYTGQTNYRGVYMEGPMVRAGALLMILLSISLIISAIREKKR